MTYNLVCVWYVLSVSWWKVIWLELICVGPFLACVCVCGMCTCIFMFACVCANVNVWLHIHMCVHLNGGPRLTSSLSWSLTISFTETRSLIWTQSSPIWLVSLASLFWGFPSCPFKPGITGVPLYLRRIYKPSRALNSGCHTCVANTLSWVGSTAPCGPSDVWSTRDSYFIYMNGKKKRVKLDCECFCLQGEVVTVHISRVLNIRFGFARARRKHASSAKGWEPEQGTFCLAKNSTFVPGEM